MRRLILFIAILAMSGCAYSGSVRAVGKDSVAKSGDCSVYIGGLNYLVKCGKPIIIQDEGEKLKTKRLNFSGIVSCYYTKDDLLKCIDTRTGEVLIEEINE